MTHKPIDLTRKYQTRRDGHAVELLPVLSGDSYRTNRVVGAYRDDDNVWVVTNWSVVGTHPVASAFDLVPVRVKRSQKIVLNVYRTDLFGVQIHFNKGTADSTADHHARTACIERTIEWYDGEGLEEE